MLRYRIGEEFEQAESRLTAVLAIDPDHPEALAALRDLPGRIRHYLEHAEEREEIAERGWQRVTSGKASSTAPSQSPSMSSQRVSCKGNTKQLSSSEASG